MKEASVACRRIGPRPHLGQPTETGLRLRIYLDVGLSGCSELYFSHCWFNEDGCDGILLTLNRGWYQLILFVLSLIDALSPDSAASSLASIVFDGPLQGDDLSIPAARTPISCHSHNDYWRVRPLHSAIEIGCASVEADVWLGENDSLLVGHVRSALTPGRNLQDTYLQPISDMLEARNHGMDSYMRRGIFESDPDRSLVLLVDFKDSSDIIWPVLETHLQPLRNQGYLTHFNGTDVVERAVTIVASGAVSFRDVIANTTYRDIFMDAPLQIMGDESPRSLFDTSGSDLPFDVVVDDALPLRQPVNPAVYDRTNSYYASAPFFKTIGYPVRSRLSQPQMKKLKSQISGAHEQGLKVRYWDVPTWPIGVRNYLWRVLVREGVDYLSVDDIRAAARGDWGPRKGGWNKKWWD